MGLLGGWAALDLDGDGRYELIDAGGFRAFCEGNFADVGLFAAAAYDPVIGAYRTDSARLLQGTPWLPASLDDVVATARSGPAWLDAPGAGTRMSDVCRLAHAVVPAVASGAFAPVEVREVLARPEVAAAIPAVADVVDAIMTVALDHPNAFVPTTTPWQRLIRPEQLHALPCPLLLWLQGRLAVDPLGASVPLADRTVALVNLAVVTAFAERIACDGPELTSLALRHGSTSERCLRAMRDRPDADVPCSRSGTTSCGVLADVALTLVEQHIGAAAAHAIEAAWFDEFLASDAAHCHLRCGVEATRALWLRSVNLLLERALAGDGALDRMGPVVSAGSGPRDPSR